MSNVSTSPEPARLELRFGKATEGGYPLEMRLMIDPSSEKVFSQEIHFLLNPVERHLSENAQFQGRMSTGDGDSLLWQEYSRWLTSNLWERVGSFFWEGLRKTIQDRSIQVQAYLGDAELHDVAWEALLTSDGDVLARQLGVHFARLVTPSKKDKLKTLENHLNVVASIGFPPEIFSTSSIDVLSPDQATFGHLLGKCARKHTEVLCFSGNINQNTDGRLFLQLLTLDDVSDQLPVEQFISRLVDLPASPRLVVLISKHLTYLAQFGAQLCRQGVPAVVTAVEEHGRTNQFLQIVFREVQQDGRIDRAVAVARAEVFSTHDILPILTLSREDGRIWAVPETTTPEIAPAPPQSPVSNPQSQDLTDLASDEPAKRKTATIALRKRIKETPTREIPNLFERLLDLSQHSNAATRQVASELVVENETQFAPMLEKVMADTGKPLATRAAALRLALGQVFGATHIASLDSVGKIIEAGIQSRQSALIARAYELALLLEDPAQRLQLFLMGLRLGGEAAQQAVKILREAPVTGWPEALKDDVEARRSVLEWALSETYDDIGIHRWLIGELTKVGLPPDEQRQLRERWPTLKLSPYLAEAVAALFTSSADRSPTEPRRPSSFPAAAGQTATPSSAESADPAPPAETRDSAPTPEAPPYGGSFAVESPDEAPAVETPAPAPAVSEAAEKPDEKPIATTPVVNPPLAQPSVTNIIVTAPAAEAAAPYYACEITLSPGGLNAQGQPTDLIRVKTFGLKQEWDYPTTFSPDTEAIGNAQLQGNIAYGTALFHALFADPKVVEIYRATYKIAQEDQMALAVRLRFEQNTHHPYHTWLWEYLYDPELGFIAGNPSTPFSRLLPYETEPAPAQRLTELRALFIVVDPEDLDPRAPEPHRRLPRLDRAAQYALIQNASATLRAQLAKRNIALRTQLLTSADTPVTLAAIHAALQTAHMEGRPFHIVHLAAHGFEQGGLHQIVLENKDHCAEPCDETRFAREIETEYDVRLIVLIACLSGRQGHTAAYRGLAARLVQQNIPAVVAMLQKVSYATANQFVQWFYNDLAYHGVVDQAVNAARRNMYGGDDWDMVADEREWAIPVLFLRSKDGRLFETGRAAALGQPSAFTPAPFDPALLPRPDLHAIVNDLSAQLGQSLSLSLTQQHDLEQRLRQAAEAPLQRALVFADDPLKRATLLKYVRVYRQWAGRAAARRAQGETLVYAPAAAEIIAQTLGSAIPDEVAYQRLARDLGADEECGLRDLADVQVFLAQVAGGALTAEPARFERLDLATLDSRLTLPEETLPSLIAALNARKHVILIGPPGTGKTTLAEDVAQHAWDRGWSAGVVSITATADWTTFDTIGGYMPLSGGELRFRPGVFLRAIRENKWLIIDEINRADIDKAFGELFTVLSGQSVMLPYQRDGQPIRILPPGQPALSDNDYVLPATWRIIGTMNVYDKASLFAMSNAFMRRFAFVDVDVPPPQAYRALLERFLARRTALAAYLPGLLERTYKIFDAADEQHWPLMAHRALGPAMAQDVARYLAERRPDLDAHATLDTAEKRDCRALAEGFNLYIAPQLDGLEEDAIRLLYQALGHCFGSDKTTRTLVQTRIKSLFPHIRDWEKSL
jgi:MoxR-like ATPase